MGFLFRAFISGACFAAGTDLYKCIKDRIKNYEWVKKQDENEKGADNGG